MKDNGYNNLDNDGLGMVKLWRAVIDRAVADYKTGNSIERRAVIHWMYNTRDFSTVADYAGYTVDYARSLFED